MKHIRRLTKGWEAADAQPTKTQNPWARPLREALKRAINPAPKREPKPFFAAGDFRKMTPRQITQAKKRIALQINDNN